MRIDKLLSDMGLYTRRETAKLVKQKAVTLDGKPVSSPSLHLDPDKQTLCIHGQPVRYQRFFYLMLNKPEGYVSSTDDPGAPTVLELLPEQHQRLGLFPCGRLDRNTVGLLLLTNDGETAHRLLSPKHHVAKDYAFRMKFPVSETDRCALEAGVELETGYRTLPCRVRLSSPTEGVITLTEGKYHQIKLMAKAVHNQIVFLERIRFGPLTLDPALERGAWRELRPEEIQALCGETDGSQKTEGTTPSVSK